MLTACDTVTWNDPRRWCRDWIITKWQKVVIKRCTANDNDDDIMRHMGMSRIAAVVLQPSVRFQLIDHDSLFFCPSNNSSSELSQSVHRQEDNGGRRRHEFQRFTLKLSRYPYRRRTDTWSSSQRGLTVCLKSRKQISLDELFPVHGVGWRAKHRVHARLSSRRREWTLSDDSRLHQLRVFFTSITCRSLSVKPLDFYATDTKAYIATKCG